VTYPWDSGTIIGLGSVGALAALAFIAAETFAAEPIIPLGLFRNRVFAVSVLLSFVSGAAMFAALVYLPEYQQVVRGYSATKSGLLMLPLVFGLLTASIASGRIISRIGSYRWFPVVGSLLVLYGLWLLSHVSLDTPQVTLSVWMFVTGLGIGSFIQVMTLAVQNAVDPKDLGTATASVAFFRSMGSTLGTAILGAVLVNSVSDGIARAAPGSGISLHEGAGIAAIRSLPPEIAHTVLAAFSAGFRDVFAWTIPAAAAALVIAHFLKDEPLRSRGEAYAQGEGLEL
jgi:predicted MFS family arabinose efflux permease